MSAMFDALAKLPPSSKPEKFSKLPEGHTVHRTANSFNSKFRGQKLEVTSPQGRFAQSAELISGQKLSIARAIGKQMFLEFENELTLRIHLGIYGKWSFVDNYEDVPEPIGQVRARFRNATSLADLRGPTVCEVITQDEVRQVEKRLGPDPLNADPKGIESQKFIDRVRSSRSSIGLLLMNQEVISGIGNVYRAELLFRAQINPYAPGSSLSVEQLSAVWQDSVDLLKVGVAKGVMITRDELRNKRPKKADRNFVYKREGLACRVCSSSIAIDLMATRKLYFCPQCQK
jgi:DNA-formamidopyrimidine glycosylase